VDDAGIVKVNRKFLKSTKRTDVISFDLSDEDSGESIFDMVVNGERAVREARARGHSSEAELVLYIVHGFLHNVGYNDLKRGQALKMHKEEDRILESAGYGVVYKGTK
jgi:probable rRNA maturation factor